MWNDVNVPMRKTVLLLGLMLLAFAPAAGARNAVNPTLYVKYTMNCTFTITNDAGQPVTTIAPGTYQIDVRTPVVFAVVDLSGTFDMTACKSFTQFKLSGPGVNVSTTLQDGDEDRDILEATFQPNSTYTAVDNNQPTVARVVFSTAASGTPTAVSLPASTSAPSTSKSSSSNDSGGDVVGSLLAQYPFRGTITATVSSAGALSLIYKGETVKNLTKGRYTFRVVDKSKTAGLTLQRSSYPKTSVTGAGFTGTMTKILTIKTGQWLYFSGSGKTSYFFVTS